MKFNKKKAWRLTVLAVVIAFCRSGSARIDFANFDSTLVIRSSNSKIRLKNPAKVTGWQQLSIIKKFGNDGADTWSEGYTGSSIIAQSDGTVIPPSDLVVSNSNAINDQRMLIRNDSNVIVLTTNILRATSNYLRTTSNAFAYYNRVNSNALVYAKRTNSNAIVLTTNLLRTMSNYLRTTSNAFVYWNRVNSAALVYAKRTNSNALLYGLRINSNAINYLNTNASSANFLRTTSNALMYGLRVNSNAIVSQEIFIRTTSNALLAVQPVVLEAQIRANSNAIIAQGILIRTTSNALLATQPVVLEAQIRANSNAIVAQGILIRTTSNALLATSPVQLDAKIRANSNAIVYGIKNNSNALLASIGAQATINATLSSGVSSAIIAGVNNANAIIATNNVVATQATQIRSNSNALLLWQRTSSNYVQYALRTTSNAFLYGLRVNSNAIIQINNKLRTTSDYHAKLIRTNSNALLYGLRVNSNTIIQTNNRLRTTSDYHAKLIRTNSNAFIKQTAVQAGVNSVLTNGLLDVVNGIANNSNTLLYGIRVNSNAIRSQGILLRTTSNAVIASQSIALEARIRENSNAIIKIVADLGTIDLPIGDIVLGGFYYIMSYDVYLSDDHRMEFTAESVLDGNGHSINLARRGHEMIIVDAGAKVTLTNLVLKGYDQHKVLLGDGAELIFGDNTTVELAADQDLATTVTFQGACILQGSGNRCNLGTGGIVVGSNGSQLLCTDIIFDGLAGTNVRCMDDTATLSYQNVHLNLDNNVTFTSGRLGFLESVMISGNAAFTCASSKPSVIGSDATLFIDRTMALNYAPSIADKDLFQMEDMSSTLFLNGASLSTTTTGMRLIKGSVVVDGIVPLYNDGGLSVSEGFIIGNGVMSDDLSLEIMPGARLALQSGSLVYANVH